MRIGNQNTGNWAHTTYDDKNVVQDACQSGWSNPKGTTPERTYERTYKMWFEQYVYQDRTWKHTHIARTHSQKYTADTELAADQQPTHSPLWHITRIIISSCEIQIAVCSHSNKKITSHPLIPRSTVSPVSDYRRLAKLRALDRHHRIHDSREWGNWE